MKYLIPASFAFSGAYLVGLPLDSYNRASGMVMAMNDASGNNPQFRASPSAPYLHLFIPWIAGLTLIGFALYFAVKSYKEKPEADKAIDPIRNVRG